MNILHVNFFYQGQTVCVPSGTLLTDAATLAGITLRTDCGGAGTCGKCTVRVAEGIACSDPEQAVELLACQTWITSDRTVFVGEKARTSGNVQVVVDSHNCEDETGISEQKSTLLKVRVQIEPPTRENHRPDLQRFLDSFSAKPNLTLRQIRTLSQKLRKNNWKGTAVFVEDQFVDFYTQNEADQPFFAVALDIGTTTIAAELVDLTYSPRNCKFVVARENPQKKFGADIISRIQNIHSSAGILELQYLAIIGAVSEMIKELAEQANIDPLRIVLLTIAGNTVMQQIFLDIDPGFLGFSPFVPTTSTYPMIRAVELELPIHPEAIVHTFPILGGFVGGDIVSGIIATGLDRLTVKSEPTLFIDIGTNGEMVLENQGRFLAAATAAGPAFEGAGIEFGMIAAEGAIDRIDFKSNGSVEFHTIENKPPVGICGSALIDLTAELLRFGVINSRGKFQTTKSLPTGFLERLIDLDGQTAFVVSELDAREKIVFTQADVRQIQLAAGAIRSGVRLLLEQSELKPESIKTLYLAGGFGNFIRPENAQRIGLLLPEIPLECIRFCGNTSLAGAKILAKNASARFRAEQIVGITKHLDLSTCPNFTQIFGESMLFPEK